MHYRAQMTVLLDDPIPFDGPGEGPPAAGYVIVIGVNAPDLATAARYANDVALQPKQADGSLRTFVGRVVEAEIRLIEKTDWEPVIQERAGRIDQEGVYYSTGLIFFPSDDADAVPGRPGPLAGPCGEPLASSSRWIGRRPRSIP